MAEGKLTVGVEIDASRAFSGFADSVLNQMRPQLVQIQRELQNSLGGGGGGGGGSSFADMGTVAGGTFIGSLGAQLATKGLEVFQAFARQAMSAVQSVLSGGWDRLVSIDTATTKMKALKVSAYDTQIVMKNALDAVKGTAFGLGDAATVAANALAAGVKPGAALTEYLKLTADTAAVAAQAGGDMGAAFMQFGSILNQITTAGHATNMELQMLSDAGLPIYQNLAKNLNISAGEVIKLASESGIAASVVRQALVDTVGGAALIMGESFAGAMENARTALDRLGEALLQPFFQPVKDGVFSVTTAINNLTEMVQRNAPEIVRVVGGITVAFIEMGEWALQSIGDLMVGLSDIIRPLGDTYGALLKFEAFLTDIKGDHELADTLREEAEAAFSLGEGWKDLGNKLKNVDSDPLKNKVRELTEQLARGAEATNKFSAAQKQLSAAVDMGPQWAKLVYQSQVMQWVTETREWTASGAKGPPPKMPTPPTQLNVGGDAAAGMPADITKSSGGSAGKADVGLLFPAGTPIPDTIDGLDNLPQAGDDLSNSATALNGAADALTTAAASGLMGGGTGFAGFGLNPQNVSLQGLQPQSIAALAAIQGKFPNVPLSSGFRASDPFEWHPGGRGLDLAIPEWNTPQGKALGDQVNSWILANKDLLGVYGTLWQVADHYNHIHVSLKKQLSPLLASGGMSIPGMPTGTLPSFDTGYTSPTMPGAWTPADPTKIREQEQKISRLQADAAIQEQRIRELKADASQATIMEALQRRKEIRQDISDAKADLEKMKQGTYAKGSSMAGGQFDYNMLPYGHPMRMAAGVLGGLGVSPQDIGAIIGQPMSAVAGPIGSVAGSTAASIFGIPLPGPMGYPGVPTAPSTDLNTLVQQQNPLALFQAAGIDVPDYSRFGGGASAQNLTLQGGPASDAMGRIYSDTAALIDRTFTNLDAAEKARHDQVMTVLNEVRARLAKEYVGPVTESAVAGGINGMSSGVTSEIGTAIGNTAGPIIASAIPSNSGGGSSGIGAAAVNTSVETVTNAVQGAFAGGGAVIGPGTGTSDSILARVSHGEWVMTANQVKAMGGFQGMQSFVNSLPRFATGGGVDVSKTVGAEFLGISQLPVLAAIVNLLIAVLLKIINVNIEARDTLDEISSDFREFRGDFQAFDAAGRLMNDTSGLLDRTGSSTQAAADERIRILKLVLEGLFKWLVEKIIVPISKAVANTAINISAQAVQGAISGGMGAAFPGGSAVGGAVGGIAAGAIQSAGGAAVDIIAEVGTILAESLFSVALDASGDLLQSYFPNLVSSLFGGGLLAAIVDPITMTLNGVLSGITTLFGGLFGGLATVIPGLPFDQGGVATGMGLMPKATIRPERVLSPQQTQSFDRLVNALTSGKVGSNTTTINAPFTVVGSERGGREARDRLLALMS